MPEGIVSRVLRLPGYGVYAWEAEDATSILRLWVRPTGEPAYVCGGCGQAGRAVHSWTQRSVRDLPWGTSSPSVARTNSIGPDQLIIHADCGPSMTSQSVALLVAPSAWSPAPTVRRPRPTTPSPRPSSRPSSTGRTSRRGSGRAPSA